MLKNMSSVALKRKFWFLKNTAGSRPTNCTVSVPHFVLRESSMAGGILKAAQMSLICFVLASSSTCLGDFAYSTVSNRF